MTLLRTLVIIAALITLPIKAQSTNEAVHRDYDQVWAEFIAGLQTARQALIGAEHFAPRDQDARLSAEGYRYLLGHLERMIEMELRLDPQFPEFHASVNMLRKWTIENPDAMYLKAPIDASGYYRVSGRVADHREWQTSERGLAEPKAPRLVTFQTITAVPGDSGNLKEMADCTNQTLDFINSFALQIDHDGRFELMIGPQRPNDYQGNFLLSRKTMTCAATQQEQQRDAAWLAVREIFSDWENERPLDMEIQRLDSLGAARPPISDADIKRVLQDIATHLPNQIRFWNALHEIPLEVYEDRNKDGRRNMPVNAVNPPAPPFTAGGVAGAQQFYSGGNFELALDQALVIKVEAPVEPHYIGFQLGTVWGEGPDQQNYVSSLSGHQNPVSVDGARYYVLAHRDPGVQGWVDTTGLRKGTLSMRFVFRQQPSTKDMPVAISTLVNFDSIAEYLPKEHPRINEEQRKAQVAIRQSHIKQRWRGH